VGRSLSIINVTRSSITQSISLFFLIFPTPRFWFQNQVKEDSSYSYTPSSSSSSSFSRSSDTTILMDDEGFLNYQNGNLPVAVVLSESLPCLEATDNEEEREVQHEYERVVEEDHGGNVGVGRSPHSEEGTINPQRRQEQVVEGGGGVVEEEEGGGVEEEDNNMGFLEAAAARQWPVHLLEQEQFVREAVVVRELESATPLVGDRRGGGAANRGGRNNPLLMRMRMRRRMGGIGGGDGDEDDWQDDPNINNNNNRDGLHGWMRDDDEDDEELLAIVGAHAVDGDPQHNNVDPRYWTRFGNGRGVLRARVAENHHHRIPIEEGGDYDGDDGPVPRAVPANFDDDNEDMNNTTTRGLDNVSSYLFDLIREARTCTSILSGWNPRSRGCNTVVQHCTNNPEQAFYMSIHRRTAVHEACLRGACRHVVRALLAANQLGAMGRDDQGNTALHLLFVDFSSPHRGPSVLSPQEMDQVVGDLLAINPSMMASGTNYEGNTSLHIACVAPEAMIDPNSIVQLLNANLSLARRVNTNNQTPLRLHCQRRNASTHVARLLLEANPDALRTLDSIDGWAPIHYAAANANLNLIQYLVEAYPESVRVRTTKNQTALHLLCQQHHNLLEADSSSSLSSSHTISRYGNRHGSDAPQVSTALSLLLEADPSAVVQRDTPHSYTPLHLVCKAGGSRPDVSVQVVMQLLRFNPHAATIADAENYLPLHHASEVGCSVDMIDVLLDSHAAAAMSMTRKNDSALSLACTSNKRVDTVLRLIQANPAALATKNDYGFAPIHCVCRAYQPRMGIVQALIEADPECVRLQTNAGETPVHLASSNASAFVGVLQLLTITSNQQRHRSSVASSCGASSIVDVAGLDRMTGVDVAMIAKGDTRHDEDDTAATYPPHRHRQPSHRRRGETLNTNSNNGNALTNKMGNTPCKYHGVACLFSVIRQ
jgi:ankyrin repeat protein